MGGDTLGLQVRGAALRGRQGGPEGSVPGPRVPCPCPGGFVIGGQGRPMAAVGSLGRVGGMDAAALALGRFGSQRLPAASAGRILMKTERPFENVSFNAPRGARRP